MTGAKVLVHRSVLEHVIDGGQDGGNDGHDRPLGAAPGFDVIELGLQVAAFLFYRRPAHWTAVLLSQGAPFRMRVDRRLPALSSFLGHIQAQERKCAAVGNRLMSVPISARIVWALSSLIPGRRLSIARFVTEVGPAGGQLRSTTRMVAMSPIVRDEPA